MGSKGKKGGSQRRLLACEELEYSCRRKRRSPGVFRSSSSEQTAGCGAEWGLCGRRGFQVDGRCIFFLLQIPMAVLDISSAQHPVKAGLSDAFMILNSSPEVPGESTGGPVSDPGPSAPAFPCYSRRVISCLAVSRERDTTDLVASKAVGSPCT